MHFNLLDITTVDDFLRELRLNTFVAKVGEDVSNCKLILIGLYAFNGVEVLKEIRIFQEIFHDMKQVHLIFTFGNKTLKERGNNTIIRGW